MAEIRDNLDVDLSAMKAKLQELDQGAKATDDKIKSVDRALTRTKTDVRETSELATRTLAKVRSITKSLGKMAAIEIGRDLLSLDPDLVRESDMAFALDELTKLGANVGIGLATGNPIIAITAAMGSLVSTVKATVSRLDQKEKEFDRKMNELRINLLTWREEALKARLKMDRDLEKALEKTTIEAQESAAEGDWKFLKQLETQGVLR